MTKTYDGINVANVAGDGAGKHHAPVTGVAGVPTTRLGAVLAVVCALAGPALANSSEPPAGMSLWYGQPAGKWL